MWSRENPHEKLHVKYQPLWSIPKTHGFTSAKHVKILNLKLWFSTCEIMFFCKRLLSVLLGWRVFHYIGYHYWSLDKIIINIYSRKPTPRSGTTLPPLWLWTWRTGTTSTLSSYRAHLSPRTTTTRLSAPIPSTQSTSQKRTRSWLLLRSFIVEF